MSSVIALQNRLPPVEGKEDESTDLTSSLTVSDLDVAELRA